MATWYPVGARVKHVLSVPADGYRAAMVHRPETPNHDPRVRVLVAVESAGEGLRLAATARRLFGDDAAYTVLNVAVTGSLTWGDSSLPWGVAHPIALPPLGGASLPVLVSAPAVSEGEPLPTSVGRAEQVAADAATAAGLRHVHAMGDAGDPAHAILDAAQDVDVVVVGSHERHWFARILAASVSRDVVKHSARPVLVVPDPDGGHEPGVD